MWSEGLKFRIPVYELLIVSLATVVPVSLVGLYSLSQSDQVLRVTIGNDFSAIAGRTAAEVSQFIVDRVTEVGRLAGEPLLVDAVVSANKSYQGMKDAAIAARIEKINQAWNAAPANPVVNEILASRVSVWLRTFREFDTRILRITVMDEKGVIIAATHKPTRYSQAGEPYWSDIWDEGNGAVSLSDIRYDEVTKGNYVGIGWPVRDDASHQFIGAVHVLVDISAISSIVNRPGGSPEYRVLLVKEDGTVIAAPRVTLAQRTKSPEWAAVRDAVATMAPLQTGYIVASFNRGSELIGYADTGLKQDYANFGWLVLVCQDAEQAFRAVHLVGRMIALTSLIGLAMVTLLVVYFAMHRKQPLTEIGDLAHETLAPIGQGAGDGDKEEESRP